MWTLFDFVSPKYYILTTIYIRQYYRNFTILFCCRHRWRTVTLPVKNRSSWVLAHFFSKIIIIAFNDLYLIFRRFFIPTTVYIVIIFIILHYHYRPSFNNILCVSMAIYLRLVTILRALYFASQWVTLGPRIFWSKYFVNTRVDISHYIVNLKWTNNTYLIDSTTDF